MAMRGAASAVLTIICCAVPSGASELDPDPSTSGTNCLWRVSSGANEIYILGSVHLMQDGAEAFSDVIEGAFAGGGDLFRAQFLPILAPKARHPVFPDVFIHRERVTITNAPLITRPSYRLIAGNRYQSLAQGRHNRSIGGRCQINRREEAQA